MKKPRHIPLVVLGNLRIFGNLALIFGQFVLLFRSRQIGLIILLISNVCCLPYFIRGKYWDVVFVIGLCMALNISGLFYKN